MKITLKEIKFDSGILDNKNITNQIIDSVSQLKYYGFDDKQSKTLTEVIKQTLRLVREEKESREIALVYDINMYSNYDGDWLFEVKGESSTDKIKLASNSDVMHLLHDFTKNHVVVISHNHPNNRIVSLLDFQTLIEAENIKTIVAVTNFGKISYITKMNFDIDKYNVIKKEIVEKYAGMDMNDENRYDNYLVDLLNRCEEFGVFFYKEA